MSSSDITTLIIAFLVNIPGIVSLIFLWRKSRVDQKQGEVDVATKYELLASKAAQSILDKSIRIEDLENKISKIEDLEKMVEKLSFELSEEKKARIEAEKRALLFENWATRLVVQISKANMTPVPLHEPENQ